MGFAPLNEQMDIIRRGTVDLLPEDKLVKKLENSIKKNKPLIFRVLIKEEWKKTGK